MIGEEIPIASLDQVLDKFVGGHGRYQILITVLTSIIYQFANGILFIQIFTAYVPKHRCRVPQCDAANTTKVNKLGLKPKTVGPQ